MPQEYDLNHAGLEQLRRVFGENAVLDCGDSYVICFPRPQSWQGGDRKLNKRALNTLIKLGADKTQLMAFKAMDDDRVQIYTYAAENEAFIAQLKKLPDGKYARYTSGHEPRGMDRRGSEYDDEPANEEWRQSLEPDDKAGWQEKDNGGGTAQQEYRGQGERWKKHRKKAMPEAELHGEVLSELNGWHDRTRWKVAETGGRKVFTTVLPVENPQAVVYTIADALNIPMEAITMPPKGKGKPVIPCEAITEDNVARLRHINPTKLQAALASGEQDIRK